MKTAFLATPLKHNETVLSDKAPVLHMVHIPGSICLPKNRYQKKIRCSRLHPQSWQACHRTSGRAMRFWRGSWRLGITF